MIYSWSKSWTNGFKNEIMFGFPTPCHIPHSTMFLLRKRSFGGNSFTSKYTGQRETEELLNNGTPSVNIDNVMLFVLLRKPPGSFSFLYSDPDFISEITSESGIHRLSCTTSHIPGRLNSYVNCFPMSVVTKYSFLVYSVDPLQPWVWHRSSLSFVSFLQTPQNKLYFR